MTSNAALDEELNKLFSVRIAVGELQEQLKQTKEKNKTQLLLVQQALVKYLLSVPVGEGKALLNRIYWMDSEFAGLVGKAYKEVFGGIFAVEPQAFTLRCTDCHKEAEQLYKSWNAFKSSKNYYRCDACDVALKQSFAARYEGREAEQAAARERVQVLRTMPYAEYLRSDHWLEFRQYALRKAGYRCQLCNSQRPLDVHHRTYERRGCEELSDVTVLCHSCHEKHHDVMVKPTEDIASSRQKGPVFTYDDLEEGMMTNEEMERLHELALMQEENDDLVERK